MEREAPPPVRALNPALAKSGVLRQGRGRVTISDRRRASRGYVADPRGGNCRFEESRAFLGWASATIPRRILEAPGVQGASIDPDYPSFKNDLAPTRL